MNDSKPYTDEAIRELSRSLRALALELVSDKNLAEDLVQDAWVALLEAPGQSIRNLGRWMRTVLRHGAIRRARRTERRQDRELAAARPELDSDEAFVEWRSSAHMLIDAVADLEEPYRAVLRARYFEERSVDEVASALGVPPNTVKTWTRRGLDRLRTSLDRRSAEDRRAWSVALAALAGSERRAASAAPFLILAAGALIVVVLVVWSVAGRRGPERVSMAPTEDAAGPRGSGVTDAQGGGESVGRVPITPEIERADTFDEPLRQVRSLRVEVVDHLGELVGGATVLARDKREEIMTRATTDDRGTVTIEVDIARAERVPGFELEHEQVYIASFAPGHAYSDSHYVPLATNDDNTVTIRLRGPARALSGRLVDEWGDPVAGARVEAVQPGRQPRVVDGDVVTFAYYEQVHSDEDGRFALEHLGSDATGVKVHSADFAPRRIALRSEPTNTDDEQTFVLDRGSALFGILKESDGRPAVGAKVTLVFLPNEPQEVVVVETDDNGWYEMRGVPPEPCVVFAASATDARAVARRLINGGLESEILWDATLERLDPVAIRVLDEQGRPAEGRMVVLGALITGRTWSNWKRSDAKGRVEFLSIPPALFVVTVFNERIRTGEIAGRLSAVVPSSREYVLRLEADEDPEPGSISLEARLADGSPALGARLNAFSRANAANYLGSLNATGGKIELPALPPDEYELRLVIPMRGMLDLGTVEVFAESEVDLGGVTLPAAVSIRVLPSPAGPPDSTLELVGTFAGKWSTTHESIALFERLIGASFSLVPGDYALRTGDDGTAPSYAFSVRTGEPLEIDPAVVLRDE